MLEYRPQRPLEKAPSMLPLPAWSVAATSETTVDVEAQIEAYLDRVFAPLVDTLTAQQQQERREEIRQHLQEMMAEYEESGQTLPQALASALQKFGAAPTLAQQWRRAPGLHHKGYAPLLASSRARNVNSLACVLAPLIMGCLTKVDRFDDMPISLVVLLLGCFVFIASLLLTFPIGFTWWQRSLKENVLAVSQTLLSTYVYMEVLILCTRGHLEGSRETLGIMTLLGRDVLCALIAGIIASQVMAWLRINGPRAHS